MERGKTIRKFLKNICIIFLLIFILTYGFTILFSLFFYRILSLERNLENQNLVFLFATLGEILSAILFTKFILKKPLSYIWLKKVGALKNFLMGLFIGFFQITFFVAIALSLGFLTINKFDFSRANYMLLLFLIAFTIQSNGEEFLIRGLLTRGILTRFNENAAIFIPAIFFGFLHLLNPGVTLISTLNTILIGIFYVYVLLRSENILLSGGMHTGWNFSMGLIYGFPVSGITGFKPVISFNFINKNALGSIYGPEASFIVTIIILVSIILIYVYYIYKKRGINNG